MDRYDDLLIKAREEMMGKQPLRKGRDSKQLFSQVWEQVMKAPQNDPYGLMDSFAQQRQEQQRQARGNFNTMAPQPIDPFGQMNEGESLENTGQQPTGMRANFSQGRNETRDQNKTGMFGRAKQGISNFMNRFRRQPVQPESAQGTVESASGSPPTMEETKPKRQMMSPGEAYERTHGKAPSDEYLRMHDPEALKRRQEEQQITSTPPSIANKYRDVDPNSASSRLAEMREEMKPTSESTQSQIDPSMQSIYDRIANDMKPIEPRQTTPEKTATRAGLDEMQTQITDFQPQRDLDAELREMGIDSQGRRVEPPKEMEETEPMTERQREIEALAGSGKQDQLREMLEAEQTDEPSVDEMATTRTGTRMPKGALPMPSNIETREDRMLPEKVESRDPEPMADGGKRKRTFNEVNNRSDDEKAKQDPRARSPKTGRLMERKRRDKLRNDKFGVMPEEMREEAPPKKGSAAKAVKATAAKRKAKKEKPLEGTKEMREEAPPKKKASTKELTDKQKKKVCEVAERVEAKAKKKGKKSVGAAGMRALVEGKDPAEAGMATVRENVESKKEKASAKKLVETTAKNRKEKGQGVKPFPNKPTQKARTRNKNPKKEKVNEGNEAAAKARSEKRQEAKKKEKVSEPEDKTYTRYISGSTDKDYVNEVVEAARNGNASAISRLKNDKGDLVDHHGFSDDEIDEITG